jgi:chemotaxis protein methyltransferase CheR
MAERRNGPTVYCGASRAAEARTVEYPENRTPLSRKEFEAIRDLAYSKFGLDLRKGKEQLVAARLSRKLREHRLDSFRDYYRYVLEDSTGEALIGLIDALTTNHTSFLREPAHFEYLREVIVPQLGKQRRIEVWSAACSSGEEPYSIACSLLEAGVELSRIRILATDISTAVLNKGQQAVYPADRFSELPESWARKYFMRGTGRWEGWMRIRPEIRQCIEFRRLNLIEPVDQFGSFAVIFCRNVMIYFDKPTQERLVAQLSQRLEPGGWLLVGHAESLARVRHSLRYTRPAIYRKDGGGSAGGRR